MTQCPHPGPLPVPTPLGGDGVQTTDGAAQRERPEYCNVVVFIIYIHSGFDIRMESALLHFYILGTTKTFMH